MWELVNKNSTGLLFDDLPYFYFYFGKSAEPKDYSTIDINLLGKLFL